MAHKYGRNVTFQRENGNGGAMAKNNSNKFNILDHESLVLKQPTGKGRFF